MGNSFGRRVDPDIELQEINVQPPPAPPNDENNSRVSEENNNNNENIKETPLSSAGVLLQQKKINHPVTNKITEENWDDIKILYFILCLLYFVFVLFLSMLTLNINLEQNTKQHQNRLMDAFFGRTLFGIIFLFQCFFILYKIYRDRQCLKIIRNIWLNLIVLALSLMATFDFFDSAWQFIIIGLNLSVWFSLFSCIVKLPCFGLYILVVKNVFITFLKIAPVFITFLFPFSISFHLLLNEKDSTGNQNETHANSTISENLEQQKDTFLALFNTFVRTLVMMIGELDFNESIAKKNCWITTLIFGLFLFLITIISMNLLTGLAVNDTSKLLEKAAKKQLDLQLQAINHYNAVWPNDYRKCFWDISKLINTFFQDRCFYLIKVFKWFEFPQEDEDFWKNWVPIKQMEIISEIRYTFAKMKNNHIRDERLKNGILGRLRSASF